MWEEKFKLNTFIGGWYINPKICKDLIKFYESKKHRQVDGNSGFGVNIGVNKDIKDSKDISLGPSDSALDDYQTALHGCLKLYMKKYTEAFDLYQKYSSYENFINIQKYLPGQGYKDWHTERTNLMTSKRCLVFMTYLNDVKNGGTEFKYQKLKTEAREGLTLIWPTDFTHTHRGIVAKETKYIITGWYNFIQ